MKNTKKLKRILAWAGIVILVLLYLATFLLGVTGNADTKELFLAALMCTVIVPCLMYGMLLVAKILGGSGDEPASEKKEEKK